MVPISPALGGLAVAAVAGLIWLWPAPSGVESTDSVTVDVASRVVTRFVLVAPGASSVHLTGDFISWNREGVALEDLRGTGIWTGDVALLPGVHRYTFVVNGSEWVPDPSAVLQVDDGFGQLNSIVVVQEEGEA
jgi:1,4-alpha-glucan branching enzyme